MRGYQMTSAIGRVAGLGGLGALIFSYGCGGSQFSTRPAFAQEAASQPGAPVVVTCEPNQRTLVRPVLVNGAAMSQVECVSTTSGPGLCDCGVVRTTGLRRGSVIVRRLLGGPAGRSGRGQW